MALMKSLHTTWLIHLSTVTQVWKEMYCFLSVKGGICIFKYSDKLWRKVTKWRGNGSLVTKTQSVSDFSQNIQPHLRKKKALQLFWDAQCDCTWTRHLGYVDKLPIKKKKSSCNCAKVTKHPTFNMPDCSPRWLRAAGRKWFTATSEQDWHRQTLTITEGMRQLCRCIQWVQNRTLWLKPWK